MGWELRPDGSFVEVKTPDTTAVFFKYIADAGLTGSAWELKPDGKFLEVKGKIMMDETTGQKYVVKDKELTYDSL